MDTAHIFKSLRSHKSLQKSMWQKQNIAKNKDLHSLDSSQQSIIDSYTDDFQ